ncbi:hypothetical protein QQ045_020757 [Rhodiola kirilowii]
MLHHLRTNLLRAQQCMTQQANLHRTDAKFAVHYWVLLHLQPYRQSLLRPRRSPKLAKRYYGPFQVVERVGQVAYRHALPRAHPILEPDRVIDACTILHHGHQILQVRVLWKGHHLDSSTREDVAELHQDYPDFNLKAKVSAEGGGSNVAPVADEGSRGSEYGVGARRRDGSRSEWVVVEKEEDFEGEVDGRDDVGDLGLERSEE